MIRSSISFRPALTRIELIILFLVVISAAGVALTFLSGTRETSKRVTCANNLHFIGKAIHMYGDRNKVLDAQGGSHRSLPPARIAEGYATWAVLLIPFLSETKAAQEWDVQKSYFAQSDAARKRMLQIYFCPSRLRKTRFSIAGDALPKGEHLPGALGDYAAAAADGNPKHPWTGPKANGAIIQGEVLEEKDGLVTRWRSRTHFDSLKRGTSVTVLLGDKHVPVNGFGQAEFGDGSIYNGQHPASFSRVGGPGFALAQSAADAMNNNFGGAHPGYCNFLMADTSVRNVASSINEEVLSKLIVRDE